MGQTSLASQAALSLHEAGPGLVLNSDTRASLDKSPSWNMMCQTNTGASVGASDHRGLNWRTRTHAAGMLPEQ